MSVRVSHEALILARLRGALSSLTDVSYSTGMGAANRFPLEGWGLIGRQQFQFGDLRIETATTTVVIEAESAGGVTNLVKYWPYLEAKPSRRFVLIHLYQLLSVNDYASHLRLWDYLVDRMRDDLAARSHLLWPEGWEAHRFGYGPNVDPTAEVVDVVGRALQPT